MSPLNAINHEIISDYKRGMAYFAGLFLSVFSFFTLPDGVPFFNKFIGLFGIGPNIQMGTATFLNAFMLIPLGFGILCFVKSRKYLRGYLGERFDGLRRGLYVLPFLLLLLLLLSNSIVTPSFIDRAYFAAISRRSDLRAVTLHLDAGQDMLFTELSGNMQTYSIRLMLTNHSRNAQTFQMKLVYEDWGFLCEPPGMQLREIFVQNPDGEVKTVTIPPRSHYFAFDEFTIPHRLYPDIDGHGRGTYQFSVVLINESGSYSPNFLVRRPILN